MTPTSSGDAGSGAGAPDGPQALGPHDEADARDREERTDGDADDGGHDRRRHRALGCGCVGGAPPKGLEGRDTVHDTASRDLRGIGGRREGLRRGHDRLLEGLVDLRGLGEGGGPALQVREEDGRDSRDLGRCIDGTAVGTRAYESIGYDRVK